MAEGTLKLIAGTVVYKDTDRLIKWVKHWAPLVDELVILDQCRPELPPEVPRPDNLRHIMVTPNGNPDLHWNSLMLIAGDCYLLRLGTDEFMDEDQVEALRDEVEAHPDTVLWYVARKNLIDGINRQDLFQFGENFRGGDPEGYDWQPALARISMALPLPVTYAVTMHTMPSVNCGPEMVAFLDPKRFWIDHERTSDMVKEANQKRENFLDNRGKAMQARFLKRLEGAE